VAIDVRRAGDRFETRAEWVVSRHSFSYGPHYDPANTRFGPLVSHNDDLLAVGAAFPEHPHRDLEIVTWVITGALHHTDDAGGSATVRPGMVGRLSTGAGVRHVEANAASEITRYVQMWLIPDADGPPSYASADVSAALEGGELVVVASGAAPASVPAAGSPAVSLRRRDATFLVGRLPAGRTVELPEASLLHVFVVRGTVALNVAMAEVVLNEGDAGRLIDAGRVDVEATADAEVLVWVMEPELPRP
jgi:redox-sensitive bicupin YhaK (pirin superfamily)